MKWTDEEIRIAFEMKARGLTSGVIGKELGRSSIAVRTLFQRVTGSKSKPNARPSKYTVDWESKLFEPYRGKRGRPMKEPYLKHDGSISPAEMNVAQREADLRFQKALEDAWMRGEFPGQNGIKPVRPLVLEG
jgi:hypothetical protein